MTIRYNRARIINTVNAIANLYQVPVEDLRVTHGSAAVMAEVCDSTEDIDIQLASSETWNKIARYGNTCFNVDGDRIRLPGVEIHMESGMRVVPKYMAFRGVITQTLESLEETYRDLIDNPGNRRQSKQDQDVVRHTKIVKMIAERNARANDAYTQVLGSLGPTVLGLTLVQNVINLIDKVGEGVIVNTYKDHNHIRHLIRIEDGKLYINVPRVGECAPAGSTGTILTRDQLASMLVQE